MDEPELPLAIGEIYAYRFWKVTSEGLLCSVTQSGAPWVDGVNEAVCIKQVRDEPRVPDRPQEPVRPSRELVAIALSQGDTQSHLSWEHRTQMLQFVDADDDHPNRFPEAREGGPVAVLYDEDPGLVEEVYQARLAQYERLLVEHPKRMQEWATAVENFEDTLAKFREQAAEHIAPMPKCECGFYAVTNRSKAEIYANYGPTMLGVVKGYGKVQKYTDGYRFQKAEIVGLAPWNAPDSDFHRYRISSNGNFVEEHIVEKKTDDRMSRVPDNYSSARMYYHPDMLIQEWEGRIA